MSTKIVRSRVIFLFIIAAIVIVSVGLFSRTAHAASTNISFVNSSWRRIYPAETNSLSSPINGQVKISIFNYGDTHLDVRMCDRYGNEVWSECCAIDKNMSRTFNCGSNVYYIEAKSHWGGINWTNKEVQVTAVKKN